MIASSRFFAILDIAICLPFCWLTSNTHKLAHCDWGARSMGRAIDLIHHACQEIIDDNTLIYNESYMLHIFDEFMEELPEFQARMEYTFKNKAVPIKDLIKELFSPTNLDNRDSTEMLEKIASIGIKALTDEFEDNSKATYKYLSISGTQFSFAHCPDHIKEQMLHTMASNDLAESSFAGVTAQVKCYGRIGMSAAAAVSDVGRNGFLFRGTPRPQLKRASKNTNIKKKG